MSHNSLIQAVLFDFDGTLARLKIDFSLMRERVLEALNGLGVPSAQLTSHYVLELIDEGAALLGSPQLEKQLRAETKRVMEEVEMEATGEATLFPWVEETALELTKDGIKVGIITRNCRRAVTKVLGPTLSVFQVLVTRDDISTVKPNPQHPLQALSQLPGSPAPETSVLVGDHPMDVECAKRTGMHAVGVMTGAGTLESLSKEGPDFILADASCLPHLIKFWNVTSQRQAGKL